MHERTAYAKTVAQSHNFIILRTFDDDKKKTARSMYKTHQCNAMLDLKSYYIRSVSFVIIIFSTVNETPEFA